MCLRGQFRLTRTAKIPLKMIIKYSCLLFACQILQEDRLLQALIFWSSFLWELIWNNMKLIWNNQLVKKSQPSSLLHVLGPYLLMNAWHWYPFIIPLKPSKEAVNNMPFLLSNHHETQMFPNLPISISLNLLLTKKTNHKNAPEHFFHLSQVLVFKNHISSHMDNGFVQEECSSRV